LKTTKHLRIPDLGFEPGPLECEARLHLRVDESWEVGETLSLICKMTSTKSVNIYSF